MRSHGIVPKPVTERKLVSIQTDGIAGGLAQGSEMMAHSGHVRPGLLLDVT